MVKNKNSEKYKAIIFDLDGTLINSMPLHFLAFKDLFLEHGARIDDDELKAKLGLSTKLILQEMKKRYKFKETIQDLREERRYHFFKFLGRKKIIFPGVQSLLEDLRLEYKLALATGSSRTTYTHTTDLDFRNTFDTDITINEVKKGKPNPTQFLICAKKMKVKPSECVVVGDSIYDGLAAKNAKMDFIGVLTGFTSKKELEKTNPKFVLKNVKQLKKVL